MTSTFGFYKVIVAYLFNLEATREDMINDIMSGALDMELYPTITTYNFPGGYAAYYRTPGIIYLFRQGQRIAIFNVRNIKEVNND